LEGQDPADEELSQLRRHARQVNPKRARTTPLGLPGGTGADEFKRGFEFTLRKQGERSRKGWSHVL
jgi:hypothetical protein